MTFLPNATYSNNNNNNNNKRSVQCSHRKERRGHHLFYQTSSINNNSTNRSNSLSIRRISLRISVWLLLLTLWQRKTKSFSS